MASQIKKKFIGNDQVGKDQILIEDGGSLRALDGSTEVNLISIASDEVFLKGIKVLDSSNLIPSAILPSYVDDVLEFADLASFPVTGETGKIYVAIDTNKQYRWSGSAYIQITSGAVDSVNGETGIVVLTAGDIQMDSEAVSVESKLISLQGEIDAEEIARANADSAIQSELDATQSGAGLETDGSYLANGTMNYIGSATSLKNADELLDAQVKTNADGLAQEILDRIADVDAEEQRALAAEGVLQDNIDQEILDRTNADSALQSELDSTQSGAGLETDGSYSANVSTNYISSATSLKNADELLDTQVKVNADAIAAINAVQFRNEKFVVDAQILSDGFVTLSFTPESGSMVAFVDRLGIFEGASEDYTLSGTTMTFLNTLVSPGNQALQVGDEIRVKYRA